MKIYNLDTEFNFGKFEGKTLREILCIQSTYIDWCIVNLAQFYLTDQTINGIRVLKPSFTLSHDAENMLLNKQTNLEVEQDDEDTYDDPCEEYDWEAEEFDFMTDGQYGDYDSFREAGGDMDYLRDILGY
jgi:hypothetical protein